MSFRDHFKNSRPLQGWEDDEERSDEGFEHIEELLPEDLTEPLEKHPQAQQGYSPVVAYTPPEEQYTDPHGNLPWMIERTMYAWVLHYEGYAEEVLSIPNSLLERDDILVKGLVDDPAFSEENYYVDQGGGFYVGQEVDDEYWYRQGMLTANSDISPSSQSTPASWLFFLACISLLVFVLYKLWS